MRQETAVLDFQTAGRDLLEITGEVRRWVQVSGIRTGLLTLLCQHTSASLLINENATPAVRRDLLRWLDRIAPESTAYEHDDEGPDDMPAHIRATLTQIQLSVPLIGGRLALGTWQGIYLFEHRHAAHARRIVLHVLGD